MATRITTGRGAGGRLVYAVGDIHGRDDLFERMLAAIGRDLAAAPPAARPMLVLLGDYVDRGPRSREVIDRVIRLKDDPRFELRCLLGNHEEAMLDFLDRRTGGVGWARRGGREAMLSYGVRPPPDEADRPAWQRTREALRAAVPPAHIALMRDLELSVTVGDLLFVHAGIRPGVALADQKKEDLLWIRSEFLDHPEPFAQLVIHGHTPTAQAVVTPIRIGLDTGAYASGLLTAGRFEDGLIDVMEVTATSPAL